MKKLVALALTLMMLLSLCAGAQAEWTPTKEIEVIIPFSPGGGSDLLNRKLMEHIDLPVEMVSTYVEGGAGLLGAQECANSDPDGYTILAHNPMNLIGQGLTANKDLWKELELIAFVVDDWTVISTNKETGWATMQDAIDYGKANPGAIKWGCTGAGITMTDSYRAMTGSGFEANIIPYDGGSATRSALLGNHIQLETSTSSDVAAYVKSGDVIPLAVVGTVRCPSLPEVPTLIELGINVDTGAPRAYYAPPATDPEAIAYLEAKIKAVCESEKFVTECAEMGYVVSFVGAEEGTARMNDWFESNLQVYKDLGLIQ